MKLLDQIIKLSNDKVQKYGAQYYTFAIFGIINYPLSYIYEVYTNSPEESWLRILSGILCFILLLKDKWPKKLQKFLPIYWYLTIAIALPTLGIVMLLKNNFTLDWLVNFNIGVMILVLLTDSISFLIIELFGITLGVIIFYASGYSIQNIPNNEHIGLFLYMFFGITVLGTIFTKNKEIYNDFVQKAKDDLNIQLEQQVKARTLELEKALAAKTEFLNNMSHEIRTPIQGFTSLSEGLVDHWKSFNDSKRISIAKQVSSSAKRLASLVGGLLDLSKFSENKMVMEYHEMNLKNTIQNMINECKDLYINGKDIQIQFDNPSDTLIQGDKNRLSQVLRNLFANAIKFTPDNGNINVSLKNSKINNTEAVHFTIKDSGIGIPNNEIKSIFEPFTQSTLTKTKAGGTGLGLSICKEIITAHKGKIWAENNNDLGASLHFIIPVFQVSDTPPPQNRSTPTNANILMIDDEDICLSSMELLILNTPYTLVKADGGISGLEYIKSNYNNIDVILLDLMMPDIYGLTLLEEVKKDPNLAKIPIILQSGTSDQIEIQKAYHMGIVSFISKPYKKDVVLKAIEQAIQNRQSENIN